MSVCLSDKPIWRLLVYVLACEAGMSHKRPRTFIGSSAEAKEIAEAIRESLANDTDAVVWTEAFPPGESYLNALYDQLEKSDFAILVMAPDDTTAIGSQ
jgi:predicted nucleotide-binding protein